jgi:hypothetical protein
LGILNLEVIKLRLLLVLARRIVSRPEGTRRSSSDPEKGLSH